MGTTKNETTTPIEARLAWTIPKRRREEARFAGYVVLDQIANGTQRTRVGISSRNAGRPIREGAAFFDENETRGGHRYKRRIRTHCEAPVAMGYIDPDAADDGSRLIAHARDKEFPCQITALPFVQHKYKRN